MESLARLLNCTSTGAVMYLVYTCNETQLFLLSLLTIRELSDMSLDKSFYCHVPIAWIRFFIVNLDNHDSISMISTPPSTTQPNSSSRNKINGHCQQQLTIGAHPQWMKTCIGETLSLPLGLSL